MKLSSIREYLFYLLIFIIPWQTRWIIRDPYLGGEVWEYGRISLYGWDILLVILVIISWPLVWQEIKNVKLKPRFNPADGGVVTKATKNQNDPPPGHYEESASGGRRGNLKRLLRFARNDNFYVYLFLLLFSLTSTLWSGDKLLALVWSLRLLEGGLLWLLVRALKPKWAAVCWSLLAAGTLQAGWAITQFITQASFANKWLGVAVHPLTQGGTSVVMNEYGRWLRAYAGQVHPNVLGGLLVVTLLATAWLYANRIKNHESRITNVILLFCYLLQLSGLFFTFSRGAWLGLFLSLVFWWRREKRNVIARSETTKQSLEVAASAIRRTRNDNPISSVIIISALAVIILGIIYWQPLSGRFTGQSTLEQQSIEDRRGSIKQSGQILSSKWLLGTGIGNYTAQLSENMPGLKAWRYQPVHNIFLLVFTELGVIGLLLFFGLWLNAFLRKPFAISHSLLAAVLVTAMFDHYWWTAPSMFLLLWVIIVGIAPKTETP